MAKLEHSKIEHLAGQEGYLFSLGSFKNSSSHFFFHFDTQEGKADSGIVFDSLLFLSL